MTRTLVGLLALGAVLALLLWPDDAGAHALLARADPPINASLRESPTRVTLFMTEQLQRTHSSVQVLDSAGQRRDIGETEFSDEVPTQMSVRVLKLDPGVYTVVWDTLSEVDGHTWTGSYVFSVLNPDGSAPSGSGIAIDLDRPGPPVAADAAVKAIGLAALVLFVGALFISLLLRPSPLPTLLPLMAATVAVGIAATGYETIAAALRLGRYRLPRRHPLRHPQRPLAPTTLVRTHHRPPSPCPRVCCAPSPLSPPCGGRCRRQRGGIPLLITLTILAIVWLASASAISHGAAIGFGWIWGTLFDALHLAFVAIWIGGLVCLILALRSRPQARLESVRRFSIVAAASVPVLVAAGLLSALIQIPDIDGLVNTDWGTAFLVKIVVLVALFSAAGANAFLLRPKDRGRRRTGRRPGPPLPADDED